MKKILLLACLAFMMASCEENKKDYDATGTFEATEVTVSAESSGQLINFDVAEGQLLNGGLTVGQIDSRQLTLKRDQLTATHGQLEANKRQLAANRQATASKQLDLEKQLASIRQQIANQKHERQRFAELLQDGAVARKQVDDIDYQILVLQKQLAATEEQIASQNASLAEQNKGIAAQIDGIAAQQAGVKAQQAQLDDQITHTFVKSPITGTVLEKYAEQGEFVSVGKPLFKVADTKKMFIRAYITSSQLKSVRLGQKVQVMADYGDGQKKIYEGVVTWISSRSEFTPKTILTDDERADLVYAVKVQFQNDGYVKIGMYGEVKFSL